MRVTLKSARTNKNMTQEEAAKALNVTKKTLGSWEKGKTIPKIDKIEHICRLYECNYDDIVWKV